MIHRLNNHHCPKCKKKMDSATNTDGKETMPDPDDLTVCLGCYAILKFKKEEDGNFSLVEVKSKELDEIKKDDPEVYKAAMETIAQLKKFNQAVKGMIRDL